jgi:hypothetical protein
LNPKFHLVRAAFWVVMVPVCILLGRQESVFLVFLYSSYANFIGDIDAWEASRSAE